MDRIDLVVTSIIYGICLAYRIQAIFRPEGLLVVQRYARPIVFLPIIGGARIAHYEDAILGTAMIVASGVVEIVVYVRNSRCGPARQISWSGSHSPAPSGATPPSGTETML